MRDGEVETSEDTVRKGLLLRGRVQGVGFRWWTKRTAEQLGLSGSVRNLADGGVEVHLRGPPAAVEEMTARLRRGPPTARVKEVARLEPAGESPEGFRILR